MEIEREEGRGLDSNRKGTRKGRGKEGRREGEKKKGETETAWSPSHSPEALPGPSLT
jgi:hypothetical protein